MGVVAEFFIPAAKVELVFRRPKLKDGYLASKSSVATADDVSDSRDEVAVTLTPLKVMNQTYALFSIPPGLKTSLYTVRLR